MKDLTVNPQASFLPLFPRTSAKITRREGEEEGETHTKKYEKGGSMQNTLEAGEEGKIN